MDSLIAWVNELSLGALYALVAAVSLVEGIFPVIPGDVVAGFLAFLAARAGGTWLATTAWITGGNLIGNIVGWYLGRRYGAEWLAHKMKQFKLVRSEEEAEAAEMRIERAYAKYGWLALLVSKFVPGVRAMAPIAAGAMRVPLWQSIIVLFFASAIWYGGIAWIAFRVGTDWEVVRETLEAFVKEVGYVGLLGGLVLILGALLVWRHRRLRPNA
jgi:membrane protein DedA with SNARE-associated domain